MRKRVSDCDKSVDEEKEIQRKEKGEKKPDDTSTHALILVHTRCDS
jgi:hypothetical protein